MRLAGVRARPQKGDLEMRTRCPGTGTPRWYWLSGRVISLEQDLSAVSTELFQGELCNAGFSDASLIPSLFLSVIPE